MHDGRRLITALVSACALAATLVGALAYGEEAAGASRSAKEPDARVVQISYRAHNGARRSAWVLLPAWYEKGNNPAIPLVISPHGRGISGRANAKLWGDLPTRGVFIVINPNGAGRKLANHSWGYPGQIRDLARMPEILRRTLPWVKVDRTRVYAFGGSMGGQESLLLAARYPRLLAGVAAFSSVVDFKAQYRQFPQLACKGKCRRLFQRVSLGRNLQRLARHEIGGTPLRYPGAWAQRSPLTYARRLAASCVPIQLWWSQSDQIVRNQHKLQSGKLFWKLRELNPDAPVSQYVGHWIHTAEMRDRTYLPLALANFDLLPYHFADRSSALHVNQAKTTGC